MTRWLRVLGTGAGFITFAIGCACWSWVLLPTLAIRTRGLDDDARCHHFRRAMQGGYGWFLSCLKFFGVGTFAGEDLPDRPEGGFVLVANHPSLLDVVLTLATVPDVCVVVRRSLFDLPFLGPLLRGCGHITGPKVGEGEGETPILDRIVGRLERGHPVLIFPEGSRSPEWGLRRFKRGAAEAALRAGVPIVPAFVSCSPSTLRKDQPWYDVPERAFHLSLEVLPVVHPPPGSTSRGLTKELAILYQERVAAAAAAAGEQ